MTYRTTIEADEDIAGAYVAGALQFGAEQAERYQDGL
ncbi:Toxin ParE4 [Methylobacterium longum]|nr:Toxin ParE4 [Methylobacterium longum]